MRTGIITPMTNLAGSPPEWERTATKADLIRIVQTADRLGYDHFTVSDHVAVPPGLPRGERFYDPLVTFAYLAALTERIRFLPYVLVIGFSHPLEYAKRWGTLDELSDGRLTLCFGVGNLREEFDQLGLPFDDRGARADDCLRALRAMMGKREVEYHGEFYDFENLIIEPHARQRPFPIWMGGHTMRSLRRAVALADGWTPSPVQFRGPTPTKLRAMLDSVELPDGFEVLAGAERPLDPIGEPQRVLDEIGVAREAGGTVYRLVVRHKSLEEYLDQITAYAELVGLPTAR